MGAVWWDRGVSTPYDAPGPARPASTMPGASVPPGPGAGVPPAAYGHGGPTSTPMPERSAGISAPDPPKGPVAGGGPVPQGGALAGFAALMQFGLLVAIGISVWRFTPELGNSTVESIQRCEAGGGDLSCVTSAQVWRHALWPLAGVIAAFSLFRGAMAGNTRRPGGGMVLTLLGFAILAATMAYGLG